MRASIAFFLTLIVLQALLVEANHVLAPLHVYLFAGGLFVGTAAFLLPFRAGLAVVFAAGLACDANADVRFGTQAFLFAGCHVLLFHFRDRLPHEETVGRVLIALLCNLALFLAMTLLSRRSPWPLSEAAYRFATDLLFSQAVGAVMVPWFFSFQRRSIALVGGMPGRGLV
jgi:hypothetical protein